MAPKRRLQTAQRTPSGQQSKLTFHGRQSRVTKPSIAQQAKSTKKDASLIEDVVHSDVEVDDEHEVPEPERATRQQAEEDAAPDPLQSNKDAVKAEEVLGGRAHQSESGAVGGKGSGWVADEEEQARKITDTQIKKYWRDKEQERLAPRVHQEDLGVYEKVLREWDMSGQYGVRFYHVPGHLRSTFLETNSSKALHRHSTPQALEASQPSRPKSAARSSRCIAQEGGGW